MNDFTNKLIFSISIFGVLLSVFICSITLFVSPDFNIDWLIGTCVYFLFQQIGIVFYVISVSKKQGKDKKLINAYLLTKVVKIFVSLFIIAYYLLTIKVEVKTYLAVFACLYLGYLIMESILFMKIEKRLKEETNEK